MANRRRGEIAAVLAGRPRRLCLTLGALAELEDAYRAEDLTALVARFASGRLAARDLVRLLEAGLKGAGETVAPGEVAALGAEEGLATLAAIAGDLLAVTFAADPPGPAAPTGSGAEAPAAVPFPGTPSSPSASAS
jgi:hypothetical protein